MIISKISTLIHHILFSLQCGVGLYSKLTLIKLFITQKQSTDIDVLNQLYTVTVRGPRGTVLTIHLRSQDYFIVHEIFGLDVYRDIAALTLTPEDVIADVGAHIGLATLYLHAAHPHVPVVAYEPTSQNFSLLQKNTQDISAITTHQVAIAPTDGEVDIYICPGKQMSNGTHRSASPGAIEERVTAQSLDTILTNTHATVLKFDFESRENEVFAQSKRYGQLTYFSGEIKDMTGTDISDFTERLETTFDITSRDLGRELYILFGTQTKATAVT